MAKAKTPRNSTGKRNGGSVPLTDSAVQSENLLELQEVRKLVSELRPAVVPINLDEEIRRRAYELWEQQGRESGHHDEHWLLAEREILARHNSMRHQSA